MLDVELNFRSSMWCVISQGKLSEIETMNGAILKHARLLDIDCTTSEKINSSITPLKSGAELTSDLILELTSEQKPSIAPETLLIRVSEK